jgi:hypothetical protein
VPKDWVVKRWTHHARSLGSETNLFLVVPALSEFAGIIEPDQRSRLSRP